VEWEYRYDLVATIFSFFLDFRHKSS
jgi:hypothetical protein